MRKVFRDIHGNRVDEIDYSLKVLREKKGCTVYVGSDSQKKRKTIEYATVIAYRYGHKGCHIIYSKEAVRRKGYGRGDALIQKRLLKEIEDSVETAERLTNNSIKVEQIDFDLNGNPKWKSNKLVQMAVGWASSLGYKVSIKPDVQVASKAANHIVNE